MSNTMEETTAGATLVDLSDKIPDAPRKRRGRPPGSKNKTKTVKTTGTRTRTARTATPRAPRVIKEDVARACLIEAVDDGTRFTFYDEDQKEMLVRTVPSGGWVLDRR